MKKIFSFIAAAFMSLAAFASVNTMNYQAVIREADGTVAADREVGLRFRVVSADGAEVYYTQELKSKTNAYGMVQCEIGNPESNDLGWVDWQQSGLMLEVGIDLAGGEDYGVLYTSGISSVPTAMYALRSADSEELRKELRDQIDRLLAEVDMLRARADKNDAEIENLKPYVDELMVRVQELMDRNEVLEMYVGEHSALIDMLRTENEDLRQMVDFLMNETEINKDRITHLEGIVNELMNK